MSSNIRRMQILICETKIISIRNFCESNVMSSNIRRIISWYHWALSTKQKVDVLPNIIYSMFLPRSSIFFSPKSQSSIFLPLNPRAQPILLKIPMPNNLILVNLNGALFFRFRFSGLKWTFAKCETFLAGIRTFCFLVGGAEMDIRKMRNLFGRHSHFLRN